MSHVIYHSLFISLTNQIVKRTVMYHNYPRDFDRSRWGFGVSSIVDAAWTLFVISLVILVAIEFNSLSLAIAPFKCCDRKLLASLKPWLDFGRAVTAVVRELRCILRYWASCTPLVVRCNAPGDLHKHHIQHIARLTASVWQLTELVDSPAYS